VVGGRPGTDTERVVVRLANGSTVTAFTTVSASPGDTVWWAALTREAIEATAYDARGNELESVDLNGSQL
jgi:plastocyanin